MKNLEPKIYRQRLTIEAKYNLVITEEIIKKFLVNFAKEIEMTPLTNPIVFSPNKRQHPIHHGIAGIYGMGRIWVFYLYMG